MTARNPSVMVARCNPAPVALTCCYVQPRNMGFPRDRSGSVERTWDAGSVTAQVDHPSVALRLAITDAES